MRRLLLCLASVLSFGVANTFAADIEAGWYPSFDSSRYDEVFVSFVSGTVIKVERIPSDPSQTSEFSRVSNVYLMPPHVYGGDEPVQVGAEVFTYDPNRMWYRQLLRTDGSLHIVEMRMEDENLQRVTTTLSEPEWITPGFGPCNPLLGIEQDCLLITGFDEEVRRIKNDENGAFFEITYTLRVPDGDPVLSKQDAIVSLFPIEGTSDTGLRIDYLPPDGIYGHRNTVEIVKIEPNTLTYREKEKLPVVVPGEEL